MKPPTEYVLRLSVTDPIDSTLVHESAVKMSFQELAALGLIDNTDGTRQPQPLKHGPCTAIIERLVESNHGIPPQKKRYPLPLP